MAPLCYRRHRFPPEIIQHAIWLYVRFTLSYRDVEELLAERGLDISYETVRRWVLKFGPAIARRLRQRRHCRRLARNGKPAASLLTPSSSEPRTPAGKARVLDARKWLRERDGLSAGGRWIRTSGTAAQKPWISAAFRALRGHRRGS